MPSNDIPLAAADTIRVVVPENYSVGVVQVGKSEVEIRVSPDQPAAALARASSAATTPSTDIPPDVLAWCDQKGITNDFRTALAIVRADFPDLRYERIMLEEHEALEWAVVIEGRIPATPAQVAQRNWDCIGRWVEALRRDALSYFSLRIHPDSE
jgi:hypothetical protein